MKYKLIFASQNPGKIAEIEAILSDFAEVSGLDQFNLREELPETCATLRANALQKARYITDLFHVNCFADDSGLEVEALDGAPGVYSARYAGEEKDAEANMNKLLSELNGNPNRRACFKTVIALILDGVEYVFEGKINGRITSEKRGKSGFGYDPVFVPDGHDLTFAEMSPEEKNKISHRAVAVQKLREFLSEKNG